MDAMVVQLEPLNQRQFGPWLPQELLRREQETDIDLTTTILQASSRFSNRKDRLSTRMAINPNKYPKTSPKSHSMSSSSGSSIYSSPTPSSPAGSQTSRSTFADLSSSLSTFTFTQILTPPPDILKFPSKPPSPSRTPKRYRSPTDVDGPNTASLSCKKRRLRRHLITSRLSQPFSLPATHILNREAVAAGDKRFLKLAAILNARRLAATTTTTAPPPHSSSPSELLRRAAIINRFRLRAVDEAEARGDNGVASIAGNAGLLQLSAGINHVAARLPTPGHEVVVTPLPRPIPPVGQPHPLSRAAAVARGESPPGSPKGGLRPVDSSPGLKLPSPRLQPLHWEEEEDGDGCAFPSSELEGRYSLTDELEDGDVYADFGVIFGGGASDGEQDEEGVEDCMDDLDGIPWIAR